MVVSAPLRLFVAAVWVVLAFSLGANGVQLPGAAGAAPHLLLAVVTLGGLGLLILALSGDLLRAGMGVLLALAAFDLFYSGLEPALAMLIGLGVLSLLVAVALGYVVQAARV